MEPGGILESSPWKPLDLGARRPQSPICQLKRGKCRASSASASGHDSNSPRAHAANSTLTKKTQTFCFHENIDPSVVLLLSMRKTLVPTAKVLQVVFYSQKNRQFPVFNPFDCWINHHFSWCIPICRINLFIVG